MKRKVWWSEMPLALREYSPGDAEACAELYNLVFRSVPTFVPVDAETMHRAVVRPYSFEDDLADPRMFVAARGGGAIGGFVTFCRRRPKGDSEVAWHGSVRGVCCVGHDAGLATQLVRAAVSTLEGSGTREVAVLEGSGGFRFLNGGHAGLPESLASLVPPLLRARLRLTSRHLVLSGSIQPDRHGPETGVEIVQAQPEHPCSCRALVDGRQVGECWSLLGRDVSSHPAAGESAHVVWIGVEEDWRGRGVGRKMFGWMCRRLREIGVRRLSLTTGSANYDAQAFYYHVGLRVVDQQLGFRVP